MTDLEKNNKIESFNESGKKPKKWSPRNGYFIGIGVALGAAMGVVFDNIAIGVALGVAIGAVIDSFKHREQE